jgi:hypothetical protein
VVVGVVGQLGIPILLEMRVTVLMAAGVVVAQTITLVLDTLSTLVMAVLLH